MSETIMYGERGDVIARIVWKDEDKGYTHSCGGTIYECTSWTDAEGKEPVDWEEIGPLFLKWDGCAHLGVRDPELGKEWRHVCGARDFHKLLRILAWAMATAQARLETYDTGTGDDYSQIRVEGEP